jgi:hypothetical protein
MKELKECENDRAGIMIKKKKKCNNNYYSFKFISLGFK